MAQDLPTLPRDLPRLPRLADLPKLPSLRELQAMSESKAPREYVSAAPVAPLPRTPEQDEEQKRTDNFGWIKNMPKSLFDLTKSVAYDLPKAVLTASLDYAKNPEQYAKDLNLVFAKNNGLGSMFREQMVDYYTNDFWHNFNEDPAHFLSDVATVASLGGGMAAKAGKLGGMARVASAGGKIAKFGEVIDPVVGIGKLAGKAAEPILTSLGFGKYTRQLNALRAQIAANQAIDMNNEISRLIFGKLTPEENARLLRLIRWGERGEQAAAEVGNDLVGKRFKIWRETITGGDEPLFKELNLLDDEGARSANATKMSEYSKDHFKELGLEGPISPKQAAEMMASGTHNPTFMSSYRLKSQAQDLFEAVNKNSYRGGFWSRFEKANGGRKLIEDVDTIMARQIASKHDALLKLKTARAVEGLMNELGELKYAAKGIHFEAPKGHAILQGPFWEKYWGDMGHSGQAAGQAMVRAMEAGADGKAMLTAAREAVESNPQIMRWTASKGDTYVPKHVAAWLNREMAPISPLGRIYDRTLGHFKGLATVFNPRFWGSVVFGNSILGLLYGISPDYARIAYKYRDFLPPELRAVTRAEYFLAQKGIYSRVANNLGDFAQRIDNLFRLPMFAQEISRDSIAKMKFAGREFFQSKDAIIQAVKYYGQAPERLMNTRLKIDQLMREFSGQSRGLLKHEARLARLQPQVWKYNRLANEEFEATRALGPEMKPNQIQGKVAFGPGGVQTKTYNDAWYDHATRGLTPETPTQLRAARLQNLFGNTEDAIKAAREDVIHKLAEIGELQKKLPELIRDAAVADRAIDVGNRFYGSYLRLSPFERKTLRRLLPFYTFNKAMTSLAFRFPFLYPKRAFIGAHLAQAWYDLMSDENSYLPARLRDYVPVAAREDGSVIAISSGYMNPLSSAKVGDFAELPLPSVFNPLKSNPVISLILKMNGAIPEWSGKPLSVGDYATRLDNGQVVRWAGRGFQTVIAQPSVFKSLFELFPQSQLINRLVHPYAQSDRGWLFAPDPLLDPQGKPRYPREMLDLILSNIIPTQTYNLEETKRQEASRMRQIASSYRDDLRYATPVRRAQIMEILRAWQNEKNRRWVQ